jgi:hypothetical protein
MLSRSHARICATAALIAASLAGLSGCSITPAKLAMPDEFVADGPGYPVDGHSVRYAGKPVAFGPYRTDQMQGSGLPSTWTLGGPLFGLGVGKETRRYGFTLLASDRPAIEMRCLSAEWFISLRRDRFSSQIPTSLEKPAVGCDVNPVGSNAATTALRLWMRGNDVFGTFAGRGGIEYRIESSRRLEGVGFDMGEQTGYWLKRDGRIVAVIDVVDEGRVLFATGLDEGEREELAAVASALLMLG